MTDVQAQSYWRPSDALRKRLCAISLHPLFLLFTFIISTLCKLNIITNPRNESKIAVCDGCKSNRNNRLCYVLAEIPQCIHDVPYAKRKYLSPVYLHTSLGRSAGANPFVEYHSHTGQMGYSRNRRTLTLYSGIIGAFLNDVNLSHPDYRWYHPTLVIGPNIIILI